MKNPEAALLPLRAAWKPRKLRRMLLYSVLLVRGVTLPALYLKDFPHPQLCALLSGC